LQLPPVSELSPCGIFQALARQQKNEIHVTAWRAMHGQFLWHPRQGCQIFLGPKYQNGEKYTKLPQRIPNGHKIFPMAVKRPNGHKMFQDFPKEDAPKFTQLGIFGLKTNLLAALLLRTFRMVIVFCYSCYETTSTSSWKKISRVARFFLVQKYQNGKNVPNDHKLYQTAVNYTKWPKNIPNGHKILQHFQFQGPPNFTKSGIFGLKRNHLATLLRMAF
jgi:hypothetical protein